MRKGYLYAVLSAVLFGSCGIIVKITFSEGMDSISILALQYMVAIPVMFFTISVVDKNILKINRQELYHTAVLGILGDTLMTVFYYKAFNYLDVSMVTILLYTYPIMVFFYSSLVEKNSFGSKKIFAVVMAFIGCFLTLGLVNKLASFSVKGCVFGILSAVFYAFMNIYSEKKMKSLNSLTVNFYSIVFSFLSLIVFISPAALFQREFSIKLVICIIILAVFCGIIPLTLLYAAIKDIGALKVSIIGNLEIPTAMLLSFFVLGESVTLLQVFGAAVVIYAVYYIRKVD
ncbi:DMT family transporter [Clostridium sp. MT-14]|jgi:drug/metabolite transporter (DMT)-like permease|uniref:DMT family transporter n=1 Tax=Clostridium aromativorans TaxID=2836848 RepID=A0ABS8N9W9_9CLOT|nr:DMT family transporter [Clostridium aromativorans]MCC9296599.1 DMT family transporter [Clostridium aromativorans]CAB1246872.1 EamA family transporter [Clostridiaceae bacterium BL-3]